MSNSRFYTINPETIGRFVNRWDGLLLIFILAGLFFLGKAGEQMASPYLLGTALPINLDASSLPVYALRTVLRMFIALGFSLLFTFIVGTLAAKNKRAEQLIIPTIDILQSIPVLSFLSITVTGFIRLFPNSLLGPECACIFAIFTAQVWNITFGFYQALKTIPDDLKEACAVFQLSAWQRFWKVEVPFSMSGLLWNMMISMSASWFFVVLSEAIAVANQDIRLPGIGSYIALAIERHNLKAVIFAIITMVIVIFIYDQIFFRPLIAWSEKFKMEQSPDEQACQSWFIDLIRTSQLMRSLSFWLAIAKDNFINAQFLRKKGYRLVKESEHSYQKPLDWLYYTVVFLSLGLGIWFLLSFILIHLTCRDMLHVVGLGFVTSIRVITLIILSSLIWVPVGVWIGLRPRLTQSIQPIIQFVAAFPANLFYPLLVIAIVRLHLNVEIWLTPLMILGTQWYILFNVIAGASTIPRDLYLAADNFGLKGWLWWKRLALPGIFPFYITGAMTAAGGAWNASIVAEWVSWGDTTLRATGLGEYIHASTYAGNFPQIALGTAVMCIYVLIFNHTLWRPLYRLAEKKFHLN